MKKITLNYYLCLLFACITFSASAQTLSEKKTVSIKISSFTDSTVQLTWSNFSIDSAEIFRKQLSTTAWTQLASGITATSYTDTIVSGTEYEYYIRVSTGTSPANAHGYISFGSNIAKKTNRGDILLLVDDRFTAQLAPALSNLQFDLISDGYSPIVEYVNKDSSVVYTKGIIDYHDSIVDLESVYLIGHIPIPYSGFFAPDGHANHSGAWPTDLFYVTNESLWVDYIYNTTNPSRPNQTNLQYDGKYDNSYIPQATTASIARIDFYNLPASPVSEVKMLESYLNAASAYKRGITQYIDKGVIDNQTANYGEGFAMNGHMNMASLLTSDSIVKDDLIPELTSANYKWMYASAFSNDTTLGAIGSVSDFHNADYKAAFGMTFGSYFGDWDTENNLLRSMMAEGKLLSNCWAGRPNWFFHHMGQNNPIGLSAQLSINNIGTRNQINSTKYLDAGLYNNGIHMTLLGDPTLRHAPKPLVSNFSATYSSSTSSIDLSWSIPANQNVDSFAIYQASDSFGTYTLLATLSGTTTTYTDSNIDSNNYYYIKYTSLDSTLSGSYYNNSLGSFISVEINNGSSTVTALPVELLDFTATLQGDNGLLEWHTAQEVDFSHFEIEKSTNLEIWNTIGTKQGTNNTSTVTSYSFIDYNLDAGKTFYRLKQVDMDGSYEYSNVEVLKREVNRVAIYPNPSNDNTVYLLSEDIIDGEQVEILDVNGKPVDHSFNPTNKAINIEAPAGVYYLKLGDTTTRIVML